MKKVRAAVSYLIFAPISQEFSVPDPAMSCPEFRPGLPAEAVAGALRDALKVPQRDERNVVLWFGEIARRKLYRRLGYSSIHQYATVALGFTANRTYRFLRLAGELERLPHPCTSRRGEVRCGRHAIQWNTSGEESALNPARGSHAGSISLPGQRLWGAAFLGSAPPPAAGQGRIARSGESRDPLQPLSSSLA